MFAAGDQRRDRFNWEELTWIREQLRALRHSERNEQKRIRRQLRQQDFWITDWPGTGSGFTVSDLDDLVRHGRIVQDDDAGRFRPPPPPVDGGFGDLRYRGTQRDADDAIKALRPPGMPIDNALGGAVPDAPGLYALYGAPAVWTQLGLLAPGDTRPLYVGEAEASLIDRDLRTHFATGRTGQSSPRRSFATLLADDLQLVPVPRRPANPEPAKWTHYALEADGDERLTRWMHGRLWIAVWAPDGVAFLHDAERDVMRHWQPPLNLTGVAHSYRRQVRAARSDMAARAEAWAQDRGLIG